MLDVESLWKVNLQPIKTEKDYNAALCIVEELWDCAKGTPEADRLDTLIRLIDAYEQINHPICLLGPMAAIDYHADQNELAGTDLEYESLNKNRRKSKMGQGRSGAKKIR